MFVNYFAKLRFFIRKKRIFNHLIYYRALKNKCRTEVLHLLVLVKINIVVRCSKQRHEDQAFRFPCPWHEALQATDQHGGLLPS